MRCIGTSSAAAKGDPRGSGRRSRPRDRTGRSAAAGARAGAGGGLSSIAPPPMSLAVLHVFPTFAAAGSQRRTVDLVAGLGDEFRHAVLALDGVTGAASLLPAGTLEIVPPPPKAGTPATVRRLLRVLAERRPDLVCTYNFGAVDALLAARLRGGPGALHHEDGFHPDEAQGRKRRRAWLRRLALPAAQHVVVVSRTLERIARTEWHQPAERVVYVPNGIDPARFERAALHSGMRAQIGCLPTDVVVGCVGHLRPEKNVARLFAAAAAAIDAGAPVRVLVVGDGNERAALEHLAAQPPLAGRVHFAGHLADPRSAYGAMDIFALTSDTEQMPIALLEALAAGLPAIATDVGDVREMVPAEGKEFVEALGGAGEPLAQRLARGLLRLARDPKLRARLAAAARIRALDYDRTTMLATYRRLYLESAARTR